MEKQLKKKAELIIWETAKNHNVEGSAPIEERREAFIEDATIKLVSGLNMQTGAADHIARQWVGLVVPASKDGRIQDKDRYNAVKVFENIWRRDNAGLATTGPEFTNDYMSFRKSFI